MGINSFGVILLLVQIWIGGFCEEAAQCQPGFSSDHFVFKVNRGELERGRVLGKVNFDDCTGRKVVLYNADDSRFDVDTDGTIKLKRRVKLHDGHKSFAVHAWDTKGKRTSTRVTVENEKRRRYSHHRDHDHHAKQNSSTNVQSSNQVQVLTFPQSSIGLKRQKRDWVIPPISVSENERGPFPKFVVQIKSNRAKEITVYYSITGPGADAPPEGLFTITRTGGEMYVTQPLDRESQAQYILMSHAVDLSGKTIEDPMEIIIKVTDQNDNRPQFTMNTFLGNISEGSAVGAVVMKVTATDKDDPTMDNGIIGYSILNQEPKEPHSPMFSINKFGTISLIANGLDREAVAEYKLIIQAADMEGNGLSTTATAIITVTDQNDQAPQFKTPQETVSVPENEVGVLVTKLAVTDLDVPHTPAWNAKYTIVRGNTGNVFNITTEPSSNDGILRTAKGLDYETTRQYTLFVTVENEEPFTSTLPTATATITVNVEDVNEAPIFNPLVKRVVVKEDLLIGSTVAVYTATDPDKEMKQTVTYRMGNDPAGWLEINNSGLIKVKQPMDRESPFVKNNTYTALFLALDNASPPATGTGTLVVELTDVNDNSPEIVEREVRFCNKETVPQILNVLDKDTPVFAGPFKVEVMRDEEKNWTATMNDKGEHIILTMAKELKQNDYSVILRVFDTDNNHQDSTIKAMVCDCKGEEFSCQDKISDAGFGLPAVLGILGAILALLILLLVLLLLLRRRKTTKKEPLLPEDDIRDNVFYYDEEGGGEEDQEYDLSQLHRGLDARPDVFRNDEVPTGNAVPQYPYRALPANPEDIGNFIDDNLKAADNDPTAPPYDSLLVFDYEGGGSEAGSVSSLNSSSSGDDQDYDCLNEWGPRFKKLADMYGGGED
ncbi:B-cadherin-like isoform X1 [Acipenser ruthenus]|uniref:B-cadherin-like isoform X1 n=1 Tax=Acipenser ruthenus TaxID=7906 RepID=UPI00145AD74C|nr:B-cadherin-like isoform X1 [Acipenser ruthenus]